MLTVFPVLYTPFFFLHEAWKSKLSLLKLVELRPKTRLDRQAVLDRTYQQHAFQLWKVLRLI